MKKIFIFLAFVSTMLLTLATPTHAFTMETNTRLSTYTDQILEVSSTTEVRRLNFKFYDNSESFYEFNIAYVSGLVSYFNVDFIYITDKPINIELYTGNTPNAITYYDVSIIRFTSNQYELYTNAGVLRSAMEYIDVPANTNFRYIYNLSWSAEYQAGYSEGYQAGESAGYDNGFEAGLEEATTEAYNEGKADGILQGRTEIITNGSEAYNYDETNSYDFNAGLTAGRQQNVNAGMTNFMTDFDKWIVPAILIVLILGGFIAVANRKRSE